MKRETFGEASRGARISCHCQLSVSLERPERHRTRKCVRYTEIEKEYNLASTDR